jgi:aminopeptidase N
MAAWRWLLVAAVVVGGAVRAEGQRLPGGVRPEHYSLTITPDLAKATFAGQETIEVVLDRPSTTITLNAAEISFGAVKAYQWPDGLIIDYAPRKNWKTTPPPDPDLTKLDKQPQTAVVTLDAAKEQATFTFAQPLAAGPVTLEIAYTGILNDKLRGFYLSKTKARNYGVTQFEATDARRAFPSFDEPALKATFDVTLVVDAGDTAISNTKLVSDTAGPATGKHTLRFATTPKMSTYLVAWLVGDFVCTKGKSDGVPIRACATPDKLKLTRFALDAAKWDLKYYDRYFGIKYPMAKLDLVAIPDFEAGAMENFGCITYRETEMLVDGKKGSLPARKDVAETIAHEMAHQWFGDLVTPAWWDNLWLNEGFATWMESKAAAEWQPKWHYDEDVAEDVNNTLDSDASGSTRPIRTQAETPAEINAMFDDIAYGKAGAVIGMVENWVGEEVFRKGVQAYLAAHLYGNATAEDFWDAQTRVSGLPVDKVMRSFVEQPGVPLVTLGDAQAGRATLAQGTFSVSALMPEDEARHPQLWTIPVCLTGVTCQLVERGTASVQVGGAPFVFANAGDKGYYRTAYSAQGWAAISAHAETGLTPPERIGLLGDRWALMQAGQATVGDYLDLALAMKHDPSAMVMDTALTRVGAIETKIADDEDRKRLDAVIRREYAPVYAALGGAQRHESEDHADLRETLFEALGQAKDPAVLAEALTLTQQLFAGQKPVDPMMGDAAVALATPQGDVALYDRLTKVASSAADPGLQEAALHLLTRFESPELLQRTLEFAVSDQVRNQDSWMLIALLMERRETQEQAWKFVQTHWEQIARKSTASSGTRIVEATGAFCAVEKRDEVAKFFAVHPVEGSERTLAKALDTIDDCVALRHSQAPELRRWLDAHGGLAQ